MTAASSSAPGGITAAEVAAEALLLCGSERCSCARHASLCYCYGNELEKAVVCAASGAPSVPLAPSQ